MPKQVLVRMPKMTLKSTIESVALKSHCTLKSPDKIAYVHGPPFFLTADAVVSVFFRNLCQQHFFFFLLQTKRNELS